MMLRYALYGLLAVTMSVSTAMPALNASHVRVAAVQFPELTHQSEDDFLALVEHYIDEAKKKQVNVLLFPELLTLNLLRDSDHPSASEWSQLSVFWKKYSEFLKSKARAAGMYIVGGTSVTQKNHAFFNTALVAFPDGTLQTVDKTLLTPWELDNHLTVGQAKKPLSFMTPWGGVVVIICYESESPEVLNLINPQNTHLIFIPSNTVGLDGLYRVTVAAQYIANAQYAYALLTGVTTNYSKKNLGSHDVGQAIFASPTGLGYPLTGIMGPFNQPDLLIVDVDIDTLKRQKASSDTVFASRDYRKQHP